MTTGLEYTPPGDSQESTRIAVAIARLDLVVTRLEGDVRRLGELMRALELRLEREGTPKSDTGRAAAAGATAGGVAGAAISPIITLLRGIIGA